MATLARHEAEKARDLVLLRRSEKFFNAGSLTRCLRSLESMRTGGDTADALFLKGQALVRLLRYEEARNVLEQASQQTASSAVAASIASLLGTVYSQLGEVTRSERWFTVGRQADSGRASFAQRQLSDSQSAYQTGDLLRAKELAASILTTDDLYSVKARLYLGWIANAQLDYAEGYAQFIRGIVSLRRMTPDEQLNALLIYAISIGIAEAGVGDLAKLEQWATAILYPKDLAVQQVQTLISIGRAYETQNDDERAMCRYVEATEVVLGSPLSIHGFVESGSLAIKRQQPLSALGFILNAQRVAQRTDWTNIAGEERLALLALARMVGLVVDGQQAQILFDHYCSGEYYDSNSTLNHDSRLATYRNQVQGVILCATGEISVGRRLLADVRSEWLRIGYQRRALETSFDLSRFTTSTFNSNDDVSARLGARIKVLELSQSEEDVLALILAGFKNRDIATRTGTAEKTVRNRISALYDRFGVHERHELIARCLELLRVS